MDFGTLLFLGFLWFLWRLLTKGSREDAGKRPVPSAPRPTPPRGPVPPRPAAPRPTGPEGATRVVVRKPDRPLPSAEEVEERATLEVTREPVVLEVDQPHVPSALVNLDDEAEVVAARRRSAAEARERGRSAADHAEFDRRIRQEPADHTATTRVSPAQLRSAVLWREILSPPVSLRRDEDRP